MSQLTTTPNVIATDAADATTNMLNQHEQLKQGCSILGYEIRNWSGKKTFSEGKVTALDTSGANVELPSDLVSPGRKSLLDTKTHLSFCNQFASRMSRLFNKYGVKFFGNYLVADNLLPELFKEAEVHVAEYEVKVDDFCNKYEQLISEWCDSHPGLESVIRDGYMSVEDVRSRFRLRIYKPMRFTPRVEEDLTDMVGEAAAQLFEDISKEAQSLLKDSLTIKDGASSGSLKDECTQDIKRPIRRLRDKVFSLYMLDSVFEGVVDVFDELLDKALPMTGKIRGTHFSVLMQHIMMMTDPHKLKLHASGVNQIAAKVAEVERTQLEQDALIAANQNPEVLDEEAQLLAQLEEIRRKKALAQEQQLLAQQNNVDIVIDNSSEVVASEPSFEATATESTDVNELVDDASYEVEQPQVTFDSESFIADENEIVLDEQGNFESTIQEEVNPVSVSQTVTTSGFFF
ncbi:MULTISPECIES: DUF3150 domain-containing protein [unclassified Pseudoalteromonas]|uniref:DUF3150 domain-containing protein n=1 Tax=unclassified Pseudoalteromonas TaxID=194690 RepID=UPI0004141F04|nr:MULTISPECIES: DUF3150 domain-containing protein [unclassified Pseudoalteromonas]